MIPADRIPLERGQPVLLLLNGGPEPDRWQGWIAGRAADLVWLDIPVDRAAGLPLDNGSELLLQTWRPVDALYTLRARVVRIDVGSRLRVALQPVGGWRKQDRQYVRVPLDLPVETARVHGPLGPERLETVHVRDMSASGLRLTSSARLWVGEAVDLRVQLPGLLVPLPLRARVVRALPRLSDNLEPWESGVALVDLDPDTQEELIKFAMQLQQEWRRSGRL